MTKYSTVYRKRFPSAIKPATIVMASRAVVIVVITNLL